MSLLQKHLGTNQDGGGQFDTTNWSVVLHAGQHPTPQSALALEQLCQTYWYPVYAFIRRRGYEVSDAQDLTQGFFACLLEKNSLQAADPAKGRFRSFLLSMAERFLANEWNRDQRQRRGGGCLHLSLDFLEAEERYRLEPAEAMTPEKVFERKWAQALLARVLDRMEADCKTCGKPCRFDLLKPYLVSDPEAETYAAIASQIGLTVNGVKSAVHRLRQRFADLVREEIAQTVATRSEIDEEIRYLLQALSG